MRCFLLVPLLLISTTSFAGKVISTSDASFEADVVKSITPVLVEFCANWSGPCKKMDPILESEVDKYAGKLKITKLDVDANPNTAPMYGVKGIPTMLIFKLGKVLSQKTGELSKVQLEAWIQGYIF